MAQVKPRDIAVVLGTVAGLAAGYKLYQSAPFLAGFLCFPAAMYGIPVVIQTANSLRRAVRGGG
jgi:hypothetical protein